MKQIKFILLACCLCVFGVSVSVDSAYAKAKTCAKGEFLMSTKCRTCNAGCYCSGGGTETLSLDHKDKISNSEVEKYCKHELNTCSHSGSDGYGACGRHDSAKMYRCPDAYPSSPAGSTSSTDCFKNVGNGKIYNKNVTCKPGEYLPANSNFCYACKDGNYYCPGGSYHTRFSGEDGLKTCPEGQTPNANKSGCNKVETKKYKCIAGEYLPANSEACEACPEGKLCLGGEWEKRAVAQGDDGKCASDEIINDKGNACIKCPIGKKANSTNTECIEGDPIKVSPGYYLPAKSVTPKACNNARKFCPGGEFGLSSMDQGQYDCPNGGTVSADKKSCILTLDKKQMRCGPGGSRADTEQCISETPCWIKTDPEDYINCIYGVRFDVNEILGVEE